MTIFFRSSSMANCIEKSARHINGAALSIFFLLGCTGGENTPVTSSDANNVGGETDLPDNTAGGTDSGSDSMYVTFDDIVDSSWRVSSFRFTDGRITNVPENAGWSTEFSATGEEGEGFVRFGFTCNLVSSNFTFSDSVLTPFGSVGIGGAVCTVGVDESISEVENIIYQSFVGIRVRRFQIPSATEGVIPKAT